MTEKYIKASECEEYFYKHLDDLNMAAAMNAIDEMPNADVTEVVRCKDCKHGRPIDKTNYLIANGVIVPPCKVGDTIYQTDGVRIYTSTINKVIFVTENIVFDEQAINNSIFLTREEADRVCDLLKEFRKK